MTIGKHVSIGAKSTVRSSSIGSSVIVGSNCVLGERSILKDCCEILPNSIVANDQVIPPFTRWGGDPCCLIERLPESFGKRVEFDAEELFLVLSRPK
jgi:dynactin-5